MAIPSQTDFYLDFGRYGDLKRSARNRTDDAARVVAQQFEGLMLQQMLASMRSSIAVDESNRSSFGDFYQEMYDKQLAQIIASRGGLGLGNLIVRTAPGLGGDAKAPTETVNGLAAVNSARQFSPSVVQQVLQQQVDRKTTVKQPLENKPNAALSSSEVPEPVVTRAYLDNDFAEQEGIDRLNRRWSNPLGFVSDIWPHARQAAGQLGISPGLLVAQAALETGWGKHTMKYADGRNAFNLFGIKAGSSWQGSVLSRPSLEFRDGLMRTEVSRFRAYPSAADSFSDYVSFIRGNARYQRALLQGQVGGDEGYIREIQSAGYATDPDYADKVIGIANGQRMRQFIASFTTNDRGVDSHA